LEGSIKKIQDAQASKNYEKVSENVAVQNVEKIAQYKADILVTESAMESLKQLK
jgi:hypothetical protein